MNPTRVTISAQSRTNIGSKSIRFRAVFLMNAWHGRSSTGMLISTVYSDSLFLSDRCVNAWMRTTHSFIVWSSVVIFQNALFPSSPVDSLSFQLFIPSHSNMADGQNPAHSSSIQLHTHKHTHTHSSQSRVNERRWSRAPDFGHWRRGSPIRLANRFARTVKWTLSPILLNSSVYDHLKGLVHEKKTFCH